MTFETGRKVLRFGAKMTDGSCGIIFFGGEPLLHKDLIRDLVAEARAMQRRGEGRFHFKLTTNGLLLDEEFLQFALEEDILIAMSLDGVREAHDRYRRLPDGSPSFDRLLPKLRMLLAARPYASVLMVVNPDTAPLLTESVSFLLDEGCRYVIVSLNYAGPWGEADLEELAAAVPATGRPVRRVDPAGAEILPEPLRGEALFAHSGRGSLQGALRIGHPADLRRSPGISLPLRAVHDRRAGEPLVHRRRRFAASTRRSGTGFATSRRTRKSRAGNARSAAAATTRAAA